MNLVPSIQLFRVEKLFDFEGKPFGGWRTNFSSMVILALAQRQDLLAALDTSEITPRASSLRFGRRLP